MRTPPGISEQQFRRAIDRFIEAVVADNVYTDEDDVDLYRDTYSPLWGQAEERIASTAAAPASVEEVQVVMHIANELRVPVYPFPLPDKIRKTYGLTSH